jgi:hypothetical protein
MLGKGIQSAQQKLVWLIVFQDFLVKHFFTSRIIIPQFFRFVKKNVNFWEF